MSLPPRIDLPRPWHQGRAFLLSLGLVCLAVFLLAWRERGWHAFPLNLAPLTTPFVVLLVQRRRQPCALERQGDAILIHRCPGPIRRLSAPGRIPIDTACLEWVGRHLWLRNLQAEGTEAWVPGVVVARRRDAEPVLAWLRAQGMPEPVGS